MIPAALNTEVGWKLNEYFKSDVMVSGSKPVSGGCINHCLELQTSSGKIFLKFNDASRYPGMFEAEREGLLLLGAAEAIPVPGVISSGEVRGISYLLLEWIESGKRIKNFWTDFGISLARLHRHTTGYFGLEGDNYIGSLFQSNHKRTSWIDFFIHERIEPQLKLAKDTAAMGDSTIGMFDSIFAKLDQLIPVEKPALLHGDLWSGNFLANKDGRATLVDPAVYYGHREMDLAMTKLFGGFDPEFYTAYQELVPLEKGFESRADIHNLYPLLVHVNLFGGGYQDQVHSILRKFS